MELSERIVKPCEGQLEIGPGLAPQPVDGSPYLAHPSPALRGAHSAQAMTDRHKKKPERNHQGHEEHKDHCMFALFVGHAPTRMRGGVWSTRASMALSMPASFVFSESRSIMATQRRLDG